MELDHVNDHDLGAPQPTTFLVSRCCPMKTNKEVSYTFRAWTFIDEDNDAQLDAGEAVDVTPASTQFTLVWRKVDNFLSPPDAKNDQPIKYQPPD